MTALPSPSCAPLPTSHHLPSVPLSTMAFPAIHMANSSLQRHPGPHVVLSKKIYFILGYS